MSNRGRELAVGGEREAEVVLRIEIIGASLCGDREVRDGRGEVLRGEKCAAQSIFDGGVAGTQSEGLLVVLDRLRKFSARFEHGGQIVVRFKIGGVVFKLVARDGFS